MLQVVALIFSLCLFMRLIITDIIIYVIYG